MENKSHIGWEPCSLKPTVYKKGSLRTTISERLYSKMIYDGEIEEWFGDEYCEDLINCMVIGLYSDQVLVRFDNGDFEVLRFFRSKNRNYWAWVVGNNVASSCENNSIVPLKGEWRYFCDDDKDSKRS